jgi:hypothetical protein
VSDSRNAAARVAKPHYAGRLRSLGAAALMLVMLTTSGCGLLSRAAGKGTAQAAAATPHAKGTPQPGASVQPKATKKKSKATSATTPAAASTPGA